MKHKSGKRALLSLAGLFEEGAREHDAFADDYADVAAALVRRGHPAEAARAMMVSRHHRIRCLEEHANAAAIRARLL
jgi:hypothetical protein